MQIATVQNVAFPAFTTAELEEIVLDEVNTNVRDRYLMRSEINRRLRAEQVSA